MIETVCGKINNEDLGVTLPHEHVFIDLRIVAEPPKKEEKPYYFEKVRLDNRYRIYTDPYEIEDNIVYDDFDVAVNELKLYKQNGGDSIVDVTLDEIARNPLLLKQASIESGVKIVMGCGHYIDVAHPKFINDLTSFQLADEMIKDITVGVGNTGIKAGVIGEIGTSAIITPNEFKVLEGAGIASTKTGKSIHVHTALYERNGIEVINRLNKLGVESNKICIDHVDVDLREDYLLELLKCGAYVEFDNFGKEFFIPKRPNGVLKGRFAYDYERAIMIKKLVDKGYLKQILITNDICLKSQFCTYGGNGFAHILNTVKTMLLDCGLSIAQYETLTRNNVAEFLGD